MNIMEFSCPVVFLIFSFLQRISGFCLPYESVYTFKYSWQPVCKKTCPHDTVLHRGRCLNKCPDINKEVLSNGMVRYCNVSSDNPCTTSLCSSSFPFCYETNCLKSCPEFTVAFNGICLMQCPKNAPYLTTPNCEGICMEGNKFCNSVCSKDKPYSLSTGYFTHCLTQCPDFTRKTGSSCELACPKNLPFLVNNTCYSTCPKSANFVILKRTQYNSILYCIEECPSDMVNDNNICVQFCPPGKHLFNRTCVTVCPSLYPYIYSREFIFLSYIPNFGQAEYMCLDSCITWNRSYKKLNFTCAVNCTQPLKYNLNGVCEEDCPSNQALVDMQTFDCLSQCLSHHHQHGNFCTTDCPDSANKRHNGSCIDVCPEEAIFEQSTNLVANDFDCLPSCKKFYYKQRCLDSCPSFAKFIVNSTCVTECTTEMPYGHIIYSEEGRYLTYKYPYTDYEYMYCVENCPPGHFIYNNICMKSCPNAAKLVLNSICVSECSLEKPYIFINHTESRDSYWQTTKTEYRFCLDDCPNSYVSNKNICVSLCPEDKVLLGKVCVEECPSSNPFTYIENKGPVLHAGKSCVSSCPKGTHSWQDKCYDYCPLPLRTFFWNCTDNCPSSHPLKENMTTFLQVNRSVYHPTNCVNKCTRFKVSENNTCQDRCVFPKVFIDKSVCVEKCPDEHHYFEIAPEGKRCHIRCPRHLFYLEGTYKCVQNCEAPYLIVDNKCQNIRICPNHALTEHTNRGVRCTNKCSPRFFLDGTKCLEECPRHKVIAENMCSEHCPYTHPYEYKNDRIHCMSVCPDDYVANKKSKKCISNADCHRAGSIMYLLSTIHLFILYMLFCYSPQQAKGKCIQNDHVEKEEDVLMEDPSTSDL